MHSHHATSSLKTIHQISHMPAFSSSAFHGAVINLSLWHHMREIEIRSDPDSNWEILADHGLASRSNTIIASLHNGPPDWTCTKYSRFCRPAHSCSDTDGGGTVRDRTDIAAFSERSEHQLHHSPIKF